MLSVSSNPNRQAKGITESALATMFGFFTVIANVTFVAYRSIEFTTDSLMALSKVSNSMAPAA